MNSHLIREQSKRKIEKQFNTWDINLPILNFVNNTRTEKEICNRINCLHLLYTIASEPENKEIYQSIIFEQFYDSVTESERNYLIGGSILYEDIQNNFSWHKEAIICLLWCISIKKTLEFPISEDFISNYYHLMPPEISTNEFLHKAKVRGFKELFLEVDFLYCYHWGLKHFYQYADKDIQISIVRERRIALEWVIDSSQSWDNISLDT